MRQKPKLDWVSSNFDPLEFSSISYTKIHPSLLNKIDNVLLTGFFYNFHSLQLIAKLQNVISFYYHGHADWPYDIYHVNLHYFISTYGHI